MAESKALDSPKRSLLKTLSWRVFATATTIGLVYFFTGELGIATSVGLIEVVAKMILYYGHERAWSRVRWGRLPPPPDSA